MIFKFIEHESGVTNIIECSQVAYLGTGEKGQETAQGYDGPECVLNYSGPTDATISYFAVTPKADRRRQIIGVALNCGWLMNDEGKTFETIHNLDEPSVVGFKYRK